MCGSPQPCLAFKVDSPLNTSRAQRGACAGARWARTQAEVHQSPWLSGPSPIWCVAPPPPAGGAAAHSNTHRRTLGVQVRGSSAGLRPKNRLPHVTCALRRASLKAPTAALCAALVAAVSRQSSVWLRRQPVHAVNCAALPLWLGKSAPLLPPCSCPGAQLRACPPPSFATVRRRCATAQALSLQRRAWIA